ncbi:phage tail sheath family protein [Prevotella koreensis]|uniref:Phage tail sheath family protein n=1 Tax=Prevotella koreensis TaxID=2490854 RepID=A0A432LJ81_9BACT|nr:phage tail sheath C-terminal domain-containing protein [Prevotella koreensis]RUL58430.1 phage tail sheath family protein [Prevotella koreensis]
MATSYKTPGVYVEEIPKLPQSVADVPTAIPGFVGYTESGSEGIVPVKITSIIEYENNFGKGPGANKSKKFVTYDSLRLFFDNGGGTCYVVSVGGYDKTPSADDLKSGFTALKDIDEVTLLVTPDAASLLDAEQLASVQQAMLLQCKELGDRFAILDVKDVNTKSIDECVDDFRSKIGTVGLNYGATYYPFIYTSYNYSGFDFSTIVGEVMSKYPIADKKTKTNNVETDAPSNNNGLKEAIKGWFKDDRQSILCFLRAWQSQNKNVKIEEYCDNVVDKEKKVDDESAEKALQNAIKSFIPGYAEKEEAMAVQKSIVPPSGAIAGIYAQTDNYTGLWKAPANVSIASVKGLSRNINNNTQDNMNVHPTGKSVNAIRAFSGKGVLVWGARTLAGNDNEWRYIPVRRLFNYVEESVQKSTDWAIFAPNNQNTWTKVKSQIENFLTNLWRAGGLAGATPNQAFYVNVGLNSTMDVNDVNEGRMIVEIGMAAVRPAEFIILRFSHKLQES